MPKDLDYEMLKDVKLTFIIKFGKNDVPVVFVPESLSQFIKDFNPKDIELSKRHGADAQKRFRDYFKTY
jgi:hypothetical protein